MLLAFLFAMIISVTMGLFSFIAAVLFLCVCALLLAFCFIYVPFYYNSILYSVDKNTVYKKSGIIIKRYTAVPQSQVLYTTDVSTPLLRLYGLKTVYFFGCGVKLRLSSLESEEADLFLKNKDEVLEV